MMTAREKTKKKPPKDSLTLLPCFYFVELPIVASSMVSLYFLELTDVLQPAQVGFRCHDRSLSMPYVDSGDELIPLLMLLSLAFAGPAASIMIGEGLLYCMQSKLKVRSGIEGSINAGGCNFNSFLRRTVRFVGVHVFGLCATALVTDVIQLATGYHTPFFLTVCKPNYTAPGVSCDKNPYITKDICSGQDQHAILSARKTFPSQHATLSSFAAVYISMYFNSTISDSTKLLKPVLVFAFAIAAALTGLTQITQYRSHPIDVYVGFFIGTGIAAYLAFYAVANFKSPEDTAVPQPPPLQKDALRALAQRGHDSVYNKGHASESNEEITSPASLDGLNQPVQREKASLGNLKRASADVELLAPRSPMGKETMVTFSNTLPRATAPEEPTRRLVTVPVPVPLDPVRSQQLVYEWKQKSMEMRGGSLPDEDTSEQGSDGGDDTTTEEDSIHSSIYPSVPQPTKPANPPAGARVVMPPRPPVQPPLPPPVSPKSASTRAKWLSITEKSGANIPALKGGNQPRLMQVINMSKQQGLLSVSAKSSETSSSSGTSSITGESSPNRTPSERDSGSAIVTIDAHAPHHPVVRMNSNPTNPWEWRGSSDGNMTESYELKSVNREGSRIYRHIRSSSPCSSTSEADHAPPQPPHHPHPPLPPQLPPMGQTAEGRSLRHKTPLVLLDRENSQNHPEQDNYYKKLQSGRHFKD
ncbi:phospholipid phosphatase-related protein type 3-like [Myxocyprinus asiaticus]|uniref:phospholipid phosphatase-related protein type 3-like n=1 Tax=Myxocyprinus asiaticus TaxID=70543 RepID=UPI0022231ACA|nr:phospholipid phosphatase-related protein type 3-like [Myxocyprinus asiaticus]XP_051532220.1 phospholipid phosphatase-related protein type 3-like [Myxocyprinus asiaticus]